MTTSRAAAAQRAAAILRTSALAVLLLPFAFLASDWLDGELAARPWDTLTHWSGRWALWFLLLTLAILMLTFIGVFCRGPYWQWYWPWQSWPEIPGRI